MGMFDWLGDIGQGIGNFGADADQFMKREMPFDSGWGAPAAAVAAYFGGPMAWEAMGEAGAGAGGESVMGGGGMLDSIGGSGGTFGGDAFQLGGSSMNPATGLDWAETGSGLTGNGYGGGYSPQEQAGLDNLINQQSAKYPMDGTSTTNKPSFQQLLGKQLMSGGMGGFGSKSGYQYQEQPVQRQAAFAPTPPPFQVQDKQSDVAALVAALRSKGAF